MQVNDAEKHHALNEGRQISLLLTVEIVPVQLAYSNNKNLLTRKRKPARLTM